MNLISSSMRLRSALVLLVSVSALFAQPQLPKVRVAKPAPAAAGAAYVVPGRTEPAESARIFTRATGIVQSRNFDIGDTVKAGDVLAVVAVPDLDRSVEAAKASLEQAEVRARNARTQAGRSAELFASRVISSEESDQRAADADAAEAAVRVARAELARLEEQRGFAVVRAPFDGVVAARNFDRGDRVRGDAATAEGWLYLLVRTDTLRFVVGAAPDLALRLQPGGRALVRFGDFPGRDFSAEVARSSRVFDPASGTMRVELLLDNKSLFLPSGLSGSASFTLPPAPDTWLLPTNAVQLNAGQSRVALLREGRIVFVDVSVSRNLGARVEVTSPSLGADSQVIVNPNALLKEGDAALLADAAK